MSRTHEQFLDELRASRIAVEKVASWFATQRGIPVLIQPTYEAPTFGERREYADDGDLSILLRVEVKRRSLDFTGKADFPFPTIIVDACGNFDKKRPKPSAYILLNQAMSTGLLVNVPTTRESWERIELHDRRNDVKQPFYRCPVALLGEVHL